MKKIDAEKILEAEDKESTVLCARDGPPGVIFMDSVLPSVEWSAIKRINSKHPRRKIIILSIVDQVSFVQTPLQSASCRHLAAMRQTGIAAGV